MYVLKVNFEHSVMTSFGETMNTISIAVVVHCIIHLMVIIKVDFFSFNAFETCKKTMLSLKTFDICSTPLVLFKPRAIKVNTIKRSLKIFRGQARQKSHFHRQTYVLFPSVHIVLPKKIRHKCHFFNVYILYYTFLIIV